MHFRFDFDGNRCQKPFTSRWAGRGRRWAAFARAFADEFGDEFGDEPGGGRGADGPARRRRRHFGAEALRVLLLQLLKDEARHGHDLIKAIETLSGGLYSPSPGMIYPLLNLLADEGLIAEIASAEGRRYAITDAGRAALDDAGQELTAALERLAELARTMHDRGREPLRAAMRDLKATVRSRMADAGTDRAQAIADILREAAEQIGKL